MIRGTKVILRMTSHADIEATAEYMNDISLRGEFENIELYSEVQMRAKFAQTGYWEEEEGFLSVTDRQDRLLGWVRYWRPFTSASRVAYEIAFAIDKPADWGKGFMSEAVSLFVQYLFAAKAAPRIQALVHPDNLASARVLEKAGFKLEGILRKLYICRGVPTDVHIYSILREECPPLVVAAS